MYIKDILSYNYDPASVTISPGDAIGTVKIMYAGNSTPVTLSVVAETPNVVPALNISKQSLVDLRGVLEAMSIQWLGNYHEMIALNEMTPEEDALYKSNVVAFAGNMQSLFNSYLAQGSGVAGLLEARGFAQQVRSWATQLLPDFAPYTADNVQTDALHAKLLGMYQTLSGGMLALISGTAPYVSTRSLVQQLNLFSNDASSIYQSALSFGLPAAAASPALFRNQAALLAVGQLRLLEALNSDTSLTEQQKYLELFSLEPSIANQLAGPQSLLAQGVALGSEFSATSTRLVDGLTASFNESWTNFYNNVIGYTAIVSSGATMSNWLAGTTGVNVLNGTAAANVLSGYGGNDTLNSGDGFDVLFGGLGNDLLNGDAANDTLYAGAGDDVLQGGAGTDGLRGEDGNDTLNGGAGVDQLTGGLGADVFKFGALTDSVHTTGQMDRIADFVSGTDKIDLSGLGFTGVTTAAPNAGQLRVRYWIVDVIAA